MRLVCMSIHTCINVELSRSGNKCEVQGGVRVCNLQKFKGANLGPAATGRDEGQPLTWV